MINSNGMASIEKFENGKKQIEDLAQILSPTDENIKTCAEYIKNGKIVGMPTETVYGLAANALDQVAVKKIFEYKGRPLSDPLIVHVTSIEMAKSLIDIDEKTLIVFKLLSDKYWPGPLTMVLKANFNIISPLLTANTDYIGIRYPNNEIAKKLIDYSGLPIAAPSANKFCHISPVNPVHVYDDFKEFPVLILDGGICNFCMESTVIKISSDVSLIEVLRMGAISPIELEIFISEYKLDYKIEIKNKVNKIKNVIQDDITNNNLITDNFIDKGNMESPGQFIKHYSPKLETYILDEQETYFLNISEIKEKCVFLDFKEILKTRYAGIIHEKYFLDLSVSGRSEEVMLNIYNCLHKAEDFSEAKIIILCDLGKYIKSEGNPHRETLIDRMLKSAAYKKINLK